MPTFTFYLKNGEFVRRKVSMYETKTIDELNKVVDQSSDMVKRTAKSLVRRRTGNLRNSIRVRDVSRQLGRPNGLANTIVARRPKGSHRHFLELGTVNMDPHPFMEPAEMIVEPQYNARIRAVLLRRVVI